MRTFIVMLYLLIAIGASARAYAETKDNVVSGVLGFLWPVAVGYIILDAATVVPDAQEV